MKFAATILTLAAAASTALAGFSHDPSAPDGVYTHYVDSAGTPQNVYLGPVHARREPHLDVRDSSGVQCQSSIQMNADDVSAAQTQLGNIFGGGFQFFKTISIKSGSAVAYGCDYGNGQTLSNSDFSGYMGSVSTRCGATSAGFFNLPQFKAAYGRTNAGISFC